MRSFLYFLKFSISASLRTMKENSLNLIRVQLFSKVAFFVSFFAVDCCNVGCDCG